MIFFQNGSNSPKPPNQPKLSRSVIALALAAGCYVTYEKIDGVKEAVHKAIIDSQKSFPKVVKQFRDSSNLAR